jgi:hypothetical protein
MPKTRSFGVLNELFDKATLQLSPTKQSQIVTVHLKK